ncbi:UDP-glucoronosyl and UDP-glucosyl transferase family protein [Aphelenchoides avenae]|nr:UDP-glucoronosyl and UDP-glucosyl transferase family protein [Aphelenchus avenae]
MTTEFNFTGSKLPRFVTKELDVEIPDIDQMREQMWAKDGGGFGQLRKMFVSMGHLMSTGCDLQLSDADLMDRLASEKFDLALGEPFDACSYAVFERAHVPKHISVLAGSMMAGAAIGLPSLPSFVPGMLAVHPNMTYWERVKNTLALPFGYVMWKLMLSPIETVARKHLGEGYDTTEKLARSSYLFVNTDEHFDYPHPTSHKMIYIGGIGIPKRNPLDEKFQKILDDSKQGVVLVSFGTVGASHAMPPELKKVFLDTFDQFPDVTFLWKYEKPEHRIADGHPNVIAEPWLPQTNLLGHPKLLAFVTHAGANSIGEAVYSGVPLVCIPLFGDQDRNAKVAEYRNVARIVQKGNLTVEALSHALREVLYDNPSIRQSAKELARMIAKKPLSPVERFVKHAVFAAEFDVDTNLDMRYKKKVE